MVHICLACKRNFATRKGLNINLASCKVSNNDFICIDNRSAIQTDDFQHYSQAETSLIAEINELIIEREVLFEPCIPPFENINPIPSTNIYDLDGNSFYYSINKVYNEITNWKKNLFKLPSGGASKSFIWVWLNHFNRGTNFQGIAIKVFMILPSLLLQKPSKTSKAKDHLKKLDERLTMWRTGKIDELLRECKTIQHKLITSKVRSNVDTAN